MENFLKSQITTTVRSKYAAQGSCFARFFSNSKQYDFERVASRHCQQRDGTFKEPLTLHARVQTQLRPARNQTDGAASPKFQNLSTSVRATTSSGDYCVTRKNCKPRQRAHLHVLHPHKCATLRAVPVERQVCLGWYVWQKRVRGVLPRDRMNATEKGGG